MKMYVPRLGDEIILTADWKFTLYNEYRNGSLFDFLGIDDTLHGQSVVCTIPVGSILKIDRIYIRKGNAEFDSITFMWKGKHIPAHTEQVERSASSYDDKGNVEHYKWTHTRKIPIKNVRFWAKLDDTNTIEFEKYAH